MPAIMFKGHDLRDKRLWIVIVIAVFTVYTFWSTPTLHLGYPLDIGDFVTLPLYDPKQTQLLIHQSWKDEHLPPRFQKWSASWKSCFPKAKLILWTDAANRYFIAKFYPWFLPSYDNLPSNIYRVDAVRYLYLFHYGGLYTDLDNECLRPFEHLLTNTTIMLSAMRSVRWKVNLKEGYVQNSLIYSKPRHPLWMEVIHAIMHGSNIITPEDYTGPGILARVIKSYRIRMVTNDEITVYPPLYFNPFSWMTNREEVCKDYGRMSDEDLIKCRNTFLKTSYVVQYHTHVWGGGTLK